MLIYIISCSFILFHFIFSHFFSRQKLPNFCGEASLCLPFFFIFLPISHPVIMEIHYTHKQCMIPLRKCLILTVFEAAKPLCPRPPKRSYRAWWKWPRSYQNDRSIQSLVMQTLNGKRRVYKDWSQCAPCGLFTYELSRSIHGGQHGHTLYTDSFGHGMGLNPKFRFCTQAVCSTDQNPNFVFDFLTIFFTMAQGVHWMNTLLGIFLIRLGLWGSCITLVTLRQVLSKCVKYLYRTPPMTLQMDKCIFLLHFK